MHYNSWSRIITRKWPIRDGMSIICDCKLLGNCRKQQPRPYPSFRSLWGRGKDSSQLSGKCVLWLPSLAGHHVVAAGNRRTRSSKQPEEACFSAALRRRKAPFVPQLEFRPPRSHVPGPCVGFLCPFGVILPNESHLLGPRGVPKQSVGCPICDGDPAPGLLEIIPLADPLEYARLQRAFVPHGVATRSYLRNVLTELPQRAGNADISDLLPFNLSPLLSAARLASIFSIGQSDQTIRECKRR